MKIGKSITLTNPTTGQVVVFPFGSPEASEYFSKGWTYSGDSLKSKSNQEIAQAFCKTAAGKLIYEHDSRTFWHYDQDIIRDGKLITPGKKFWEPYEPRKIRRDLTLWIISYDHANKLTTGKLDDIIKICADTFAEPVENVRDTHLCFRDTLLDLNTFEPCEKDPAKFASVFVDWEYTKLNEAPCPMFEKYLNETCVDDNGNPDPKMEMMLQEASGYLLTSVRGAKSFILLGRSRTGKSVFLQLLRRMVGKNRTHAATLDELTAQPFNLAALRSKKANIVDEDESLGDKGGGRIDMFKKLVANEPINFRDLYEQATTAVLNALLFLGTNKMPVIRGFDDAVRERILMIRFPHVVPPENRIGDLANIIMDSGEGPGLVRWALQGLKRLKENNFIFTMSEDSKSLLNELESASSSVLDFLNQHYEMDKDGFITCEGIYDHYSLWCADEGREAVSKNRFGREAGAKIGQSFSKGTEQGVKRCYKLKRKLVETQGVI